MKSAFVGIATVLVCALVFIAPTVVVRCFDVAPVSVQTQSVKVGVVGPYVELRGIGSGVWVSKTRILTARHVVTDHNQPDPIGPLFVDILKIDGGGTETKSYRAVVLFTGGALRDLALLEVNTGEDGIDHATAAVDYRVRVELGEDCWYVGSPQGKHGCLERSIISIPRTPIQSAPHVIVNGNADYGNSGGPLYVQRGGTFFLVGICSRFYSRSPRSPVAFVHATSVYAMLRRSAVTPEYKGEWK